MTFLGFLLHHAPPKLPDLLSHFRLASPDRFIALVYREFDKSNIAGVAGLVERYRASGDVLARDIFDSAAQELVALACSARHVARRRSQ